MYLVVEISVSYLPDWVNVGQRSVRMSSPWPDNNNDNIYLFNFEYNTNSYSKNYNITDKFSQNRRRHVYFFDCKMALRQFTFSNGEILPLVDYGLELKLEVTYTGDVPWANLTLTSITALSFDFVLKKL